MTDLSIEEMLHRVAKGFRRDPRITLHTYFELLDWAQVFRVKQIGADDWKGDIGYRYGDGPRYALLFLVKGAAEAVAARVGGELILPMRGRDFLKRLADGWGLIVDSGTDSEMRIEPADLTDLIERIGIKQVHQEATDEWLERADRQLSTAGVPQESRAEQAMRLWGEANPFGVVPSSRRGRRISAFFSPAALASPTVEDYERDPYLRYLPPAELDERLADLLSNLSFVRQRHFHDELTVAEWLELFRHVEFECRHRSVSFVDACRRASPLGSWPRLAAARAAVSRYQGRPGQLFKYGHAKYLEDMLRSGTVRVGLASSHGDPGLRRGRQDDELVRTVLLDPQTTKVRMRDGRPIDIRGPISYNVRSPGDYYLWCSSVSLDARMFDDFGVYDACLVIHDEAEFTERFLAAGDEQLPGQNGAVSFVRYYDPLRSSPEALATFEKPLRYAYQREHRFVWDVPRTQTAPRKEVYLRLGDLTQIATLLKLSQGG